MNNDSYTAQRDLEAYCSNTPLHPRGGSPSLPQKRRIPAILFLLPVAVIVAGARTPARAESDSARVDRLFMWASSGEVRFLEKVSPAKDSLAAMGENGARWLARKMDATDARERRTLADIFERIGSPGAAFLVPYLDSAGIYMPQNAARCLGLAKDTSAALPLTRKLDHSYYGVRSEVATALGKIADRRGVSPILDQLSGEEDSDVRKSCVVSLGLIGDSQATDALIGTLSDPFFGVRQTAVISLGQIKPPPVARLIASVRDLTGIGLHGALVALGRCDDAKARKLLNGMLENPSPLIRGFAIEGLSAHPDKHVVNRVGKLKKVEKDPFVLAQIARLEQRRSP